MMSNNDDRQIERHELWEEQNEIRKRERYEKNLPICDICGETIETEEMYLVDGVPVCLDCVEKANVSNWVENSLNRAEKYGE